MLNTLILLDVCLCPLHQNVFIKYVKLSVCQLSPIKLFPWFVVIHTVRGFSVVNEAKVDFFLEFPCFLYDQTKVGNLTSSSSAFSNKLKNC